MESLQRESALGLPNNHARRTKPKRERKHDYTFLSLEEAQNIVIPVVLKVSQLVKRNGERTVPGWRNRLSQWLLREERGNKHDARTPLFASMSYAEIAKTLLGLVRHNLGRVKTMYSTIPSMVEYLFKLEEHQAEKIGGRGLFPPAHIWMKHLTDVVMSDVPVPEGFDKQALSKAIADLVRQVPASSLDADDSSINEGFVNAGTGEADTKALNVETNSCYPTYVKRWFHKVWTATVSMNQRLVQIILVRQARSAWLSGLRAKDWRDIIPDFVGTANQRTNVASGHVATEDNTYQGIIMSKLRLVVAMPKLDTIIGKVFLNRLIPAVTQIKNPDGSRPFIALTTPERIDKNMQVILSTAAKHKLRVLSTDFSHFDQSVAPWLAWEIAKAISVWFTPQVRKIFLAWVYAAFYNTKLITPFGIYNEGPSRMKSGSWLTNIFDSFINYVSQRYGLYRGYYKSILAQVVQGDDALLLGDGCTPDNFEKCVAELGFEGNASKQGYDWGALYFCQKMHIYGYPGGIYPISRATAAIVSLEDDVGIETGDEYDEFPFVLTYRTVCRLDSACFNPNFADFVNLVAKDDKLHLGKDMTPDELARLAGSYHVKMQQEYNDKPWKSHGSLLGGKHGFAHFPVNRVLRGELPPPPGIRLFEWVYGISYGEVPV